MKITLRFSATFCAALSGLLLLAASPRTAAAAAVPGTPLNGTDTGSGSLDLFATTVPVGGAPYSDSTDFSDATSGVPGDIVILTPVAGSTVLDEDRSNWAAVARFFSPADLDGSKGTAATEEIGFLAAASDAGPATDFSAFTLLPNVFYVNAVVIVPDEVDTVFTLLGPTGAIPAKQTAIFDVFVEGVPEPATVALLALGAPLLLARRRRTRNSLERQRLSFLTSDLGKGEHPL